MMANETFIAVIETLPCYSHKYKKSQVILSVSLLNDYHIHVALRIFPLWIMGGHLHARKILFIAIGSCMSTSL